MILALLFAANCINQGSACGGETTTQCCSGLECIQPNPRSTVKLCEPIAGSTTTTTMTTTTSSTNQVTTTIVSSTTTTTISSIVSDSHLRFLPALLGLQRPSGDALVDPRNNLPSTERVRLVEALQVNWQYLPKILNAYSNPDDINYQAIQDTVSKFLINYVVRGGLAYQWYHPTYSWDIPREDAMQGLVGKSLSNASPEALALIGATKMPPMPSAPDPYPDSDDGRLSQLPNLPLTDVQCDLLQQAEQTHMAQSEAVKAGSYALASTLIQPEVDAQLAFEDSGRNTAEQNLFTGIWDPDVNFSLPLATIVGLTNAIESAHMRRTAAFNCGTGKPPDVARIETEGAQHAIEHFCRDLNPAVFQKTTFRTGCTDQPIDDCPTLSCEQISQLP